jgi:hypothetical protein
MRHASSSHAACCRANFRPNPAAVYISPFGTPEWISRTQAQKQLEADHRRCVGYREWGLLTERQHNIGPQHIAEAPVSIWRNVAIERDEDNCLDSDEAGRLRGPR